MDGRPSGFERGAVQARPRRQARFRSARSAGSDAQRSLLLRGSASVAVAIEAARRPFPRSGSSRPPAAAGFAFPGWLHMRRPGAHDHLDLAGAARSRELRHVLLPEVELGAVLVVRSTQKFEVLERRRASSSERLLVVNL